MCPVALPAVIYNYLLMSNSFFQCQHDPDQLVLSTRAAVAIVYCGKNLDRGGDFFNEVHNVPSEGWLL